MMPKQNWIRSQLFIGAVIAFGVVFFLLALHLPHWAEPYFQIDDDSLVNPLFLRRPWTWASWLTLWTPGNQVDFYPLRDLSHWIDWTFSHELENNLFVAKAQQFAWFLVLGLCLFGWLCRLGIDRFQGWLLSVLWILLPLHAESLFWVSARKDLLALAFCLGALFVWEREKREMRHPWLTLGLFVCSLLGKATFALIPLLLFAEDRRQLRHRWGLVVVSLAGIAGHAWIYRAVNPMALRWDLGTRWFGHLEALGRAAVSLLNPQVQAVDLDNWGEWTASQSSYLVPGVITALVLCWIVIRGFRAHARTASMAAFASWLLIPGVLADHRHLYSIRYFEPVFLFAGVSAWLQWGARIPHRYRKPAFLGALFVLTLQNWFVRDHWISNRAVVQHARDLQPENPALLYYLTTEELNLSRWGRLEAEEKIVMKDHIQELMQICLIPSQSPLLCYSFLRAAPVFVGTLRSVTVDERDDFRRRLRIIEEQLLSPSHAARLQVQRNRSPEVLRSKLIEFAEPFPIPNTNSRLWEALRICVREGEAQSRQWIARKQMQNLIENVDLADFGENWADPVERTWVHGCLRGPALGG